MNRFGRNAIKALQDRKAGCLNCERNYRWVGEKTLEPKGNCGYGFGNCLHKLSDTEKYTYRIEYNGVEYKPLHDWKYKKWIPLSLYAESEILTDEDFEL